MLNLLILKILVYFQTGNIVYMYCKTLHVFEFLGKFVTLVVFGVYTFVFNRQDNSHHTNEKPWFTKTNKML